MSGFRLQRKRPDQRIGTTGWSSIKPERRQPVSARPGELADVYEPDGTLMAGIHLL